MALLALVLIICINCISAKHVTATTTNSTGEFYINSQVTDDSNYFQYDSISCTLSYCHIVCDETFGCYGLTINSASSTDTLIIDCAAKQGCYQLQINANIASNTNLYLNCNYPQATATSDSSCHSVTLNASDSLSAQINCNDYNCYNSNFYLDYTDSVLLNFDGPYASQFSNISANYISNGLDINCISNYSCYYSIINANIMTNYLNLKCNNTYSCYHNKIYVNSIIDYVHIDCLDDHSCSNMIVDASNVSRNLNIQCDGINGCSSSTIYCPESSLCNINCTSIQSCYDTSFYVENRFVDTFNVYCNTSVPSSCGGNADINCQTSGDLSNLLYDQININWICASYECCPIRSGIIKCDADSVCMIDCKNQSCLNQYIDATEANELSIDCSTSTGSGSGCMNTKIECPTGDDTVCNVNCTESYSCKYAIIETGIGNQMNEFMLNCHGERSCDYTSILLQSDYIINTDIRCNGSYSCQYLWLYLLSPMMNTFAVECINDYSCYSLSINATDLQIDTFSLLCDASYSCNSFTLIASTSTINNLDIDCIDGVNACLSMDINTIITSNADIDCLHNAVCHDLTLDLISKSSDTSININCSNPLISSIYSDGACFAAKFIIDGYEENSVKSNEITITCDQYDCYGITLSILDLNKVQINCLSPYSCKSAVISSATANLLDLNCENIESCYDTLIDCPYREVASCDIHCNHESQSCYSMTINVPDYYIYNYLKIICAKEEIWSTQSCYNMQFKCTSDSNWRHDTSLTYSTNKHSYICVNSSDISSCCPYFDGPSINCEDNKYCNINCTNHSCDNSLINGTFSSYLDINCQPFGCQQTAIYCPSSGCNIECNGNSSCYDTQIVYTESLNDNGTVSIQCKDDFSCILTDINAEYVANLTYKVKGYAPYNTINAQNAGQISIDCKSEEKNEENGYKLCYYLHVDAQYANQINVSCKEFEACNEAQFYVNNAESVNIEASGNLSLHESYILANNAESLIIDCAANYDNFACYSNKWYLSEKHKVKFNCYGTGCNDLGTLYLYNKSEITYNINGCHQCGTINDCIDGDIVYITNDTKPVIHTTTTPNSDNIYNMDNIKASQLGFNCSKLQSLGLDCNEVNNALFPSITPIASNTPSPSIQIQSNWTKGLTLPYGEPYYGMSYDLGQTVFNQMFHDSTYHIIRRECYVCNDEYEDIYYKRLTNITTFDVYNLMKYWTSINNILGTDFNLYSTLNDALNDKNAWLYCDYDATNIGAFRDCSIYSNNPVPNQWTGSNSGQLSRFSIYTYSGTDDNNNNNEHIFGGNHSVFINDVYDQQCYSPKQYTKTTSMTLIITVIGIFAIVFIGGLGILYYIWKKKIFRNFISGLSSNGNTKTLNKPLLDTQELVNMDDDNQCLICCDNVANMFNDPCGHTTYCSECAIDALKHDNKCPSCRQNIQCKQIYRAGFSS